MSSSVSPALLGKAWPKSLLLDVSLLAVDRISSTQILSRKLLDRHLAEDEDPKSFAVVALEQTAGRGRHGRDWASARGLGVWASLVLAVDAEVAPSLPMRAAIALAEVLGEASGRSCGIKWPNDLMIGRRKIGGLLVDLVASTPGPAWAIVGFGLNHGHEASELPTSAATSLRLESRHAALPSLAEVAARAIAAVFGECGPSRRRDWLDRYRRLSVHSAGSLMVCNLAEGSVEGRFVDFDQNGFLQLEVESGRRSIRSGEVFSW